VLERSVGSQDRVVGLNDRAAHSGSRIDGELELALLSIVGRESLQ